MAARKEPDERTKAMIESFVPLRDEGKSIAEIAKMFEISSRTVYNYLGVISKNSGRSRESLLHIPHKEHEMTVAKEYKATDELNVEELRRNFSNAVNEIDNVIKGIDKALEEDENRYQKIIINNKEER